MNAQASPKENFSTTANRRGKTIPYPTNRRPISATLPAVETGQRLSALFPNGWDWIYAAAPTADRKPEWTTVKKHPLTPIEQWSHHQNPAIVIGIRPNANTRWGILDIDKTSQYHPTQNPAALQIIRNALEDIGITRTILNQSSHSGGLHLYIPLPEEVSSYWLSITLKYNLEAVGIQIRSGQCELFPNPKKYIPEGQGFSHFNGIRLPMQPNTGFIPLDLDLNPLPWNLEDWLNAFDQAAAHQDPIKLKRQIKDAKENYKIRTYRDPESVDSWRERLHQEKIQGWTGPGQTNEKLKAIACEARVFLNMDSEQQIAEYIQETAQTTPGFHQYSNHTRDIGQRSREVAQWSMRYYWPIGATPSRKTGYHTPVPQIASFSYHQAKREAAQERIKEAIAQLQSQNNLSPLASERAKQIAQIGKVSQQTLYKSFNKPLWHPAHLPTSDSIPIAETLIQQNITLLDTKQPKNQNQESPEPLLKLDFSLPFKYVGFVLLYLLSEAVAALPPQGQRAAETAIAPSEQPPNLREGGSVRGENPPVQLTITNFAELKTSLPASLQAKIAQAEHQQKRDQTQEQQRRERVLAQHLHLTPPPNVPERTPIPPLCSNISPPAHESSQQRPPTPGEEREFTTWYALAEQFKLVSEYRWEYRDYWVLTLSGWETYSEMSGTFTTGRLHRYLSGLPHSGINFSPSA